MRYALAIRKLISLCTLMYLALLHSFFVDSIHTGAAYSSCGSIAPLCIVLSASCFSPQLQHVTVLNTVDSCNTMVSIIIYYNIIVLYYNLMGPPSDMRSVVDRNIVMRRMSVLKVKVKQCRYRPGVAQAVPGS
jgi:hypothetical protein